MFQIQVARQHSSVFLNTQYFTDAKCVSKPSLKRRRVSHLIAWRS